MRVLLILALALLASGTAHAAGPLELPVDLPPMLDPSTPAPPDVDDAISQLGVDVPLEDAAPGAPRMPGKGMPLALDVPTVAVTAGGVALALVGFALYSRLARSELLDNERRDEVNKLILESPGIALSDIAQRTGLGWGTTVYHLDRLERAGFVASESHAGRRCYFPVGTLPREARPMLGALQQETTRSVAQFVATRPGATQTELCEGLGLSASAASKQVSKLESAGLVRRERDWKTVRLHPGPALASMLSGGATASA
jgi:predicted transcriptional regulator